MRFVPIGVLLMLTLAHKSSQVPGPGLNRTMRAKRYETLELGPLESAEIEGVEASFYWADWASQDAYRIGTAFQLKKGDKMVESAVLYAPRDGYFVVKNLLDAAGYEGELKKVRTKEALANLNLTTPQDTVPFKLDTPRIVSNSESKKILNALAKLPKAVIRLDSVSVALKIPKQKEEVIMEVYDLLSNGSTGKAIIHVVPNTVSVVVNDLPAQTVVRISMRLSPGYSRKEFSSVNLFTGSVTETGPKIGSRSNAQNVRTPAETSATKVSVNNRRPSSKRPTVTCFVENKAPFQGFPCRNSNVCIPLNWECDGEEDCDGGHDEIGCVDGLSAYSHNFMKRNGIEGFGRCKKNEFECLLRGVNVCLPSNWLCDGRVDCSDGWDEDRNNCRNSGHHNSFHHTYNPSQCNHNNFKCKRGGCVPLRYICDGRGDCSDGSDEFDCPEDEEEDDEDSLNVNCDPDHEFVCPGYKTRRKKCVPRPWVCDDQEDCPWGEDETEDVCNSRYHNFHD